MGVAVQGRASTVHALTGIRAVFAGGVLAYHFVPFAALYVPAASGLAVVTDVGWIGVDGFFLLSGFLLAHHHLGRRWSVGALRGFFQDRLARIYPVYLLATLVAGLLVFVAVVAGLAVDPGHFTWRSALANVLLVQAWRPYPLPSWDPPAWSVSCEWLAYLAFPVLAAAFVRVPQRLEPLLFVLLGVGLVLPVTVALAGGAPGVVDLARVAGAFTAGMLLHRCGRGVASSRVWGYVAACAFVAAASLAVFALSAGSPAWALGGLPLLALGIFGLAHDDGVMGRVLGSRTAVFWGQASYSVYLFHALLLLVVRRVAPPGRLAWMGDVGGVLLLAVTLAGILAVSAVVFRHVEEPARQRLRSRPERPALATQEPVEPAQSWKGV